MTLLLQPRMWTPGPILQGRRVLWRAQPSAARPASGRRGAPPR
ncbi:hypothetical protein BN1012_Phect1618 [Candidatus Phaeomarinobacter ectocarpi]|uniref:Uncharacterized protein n=1 Tax=Candidatus Phaeomarinibacter ectocarpi TaxID=1458461 RepID=X5MD37_9HYPH|nr:hypothetical protein BN1012_Phect1618 [Candidatus Phaeomarinobacter ectocarpi]